MRVLPDATIPSRDARRLGLTAVRPQDGVVQVPANPYDARQMVAYLRQHPSEAKALIWTVNLELTAIYAIQPEGRLRTPFSRARRRTAGTNRRGN